MVDYILELPLLGVDEDNLDDFREVFLKHFFHETTLFRLDLFRVIAQIVRGYLPQIPAVLLPNVIIHLKMLDKVSQPSESHIMAFIDIILLITVVRFQESTQLDDNVSIELQTSRIWLLKVLQELL